MRSFLLLALTLTSVSVRAGYYPEWAQTQVAPLADVIALAAADFNGDGRPDTIALAGGNVSLVRTNADGTPGESTAIFNGAGAIDLVVAKFDGDTKADVAVATASSIVLLRSNGNGTFATPQTIPIDVPVWFIAAADFTNDGRADIAIQTTPGMIILRSVGDGTFVEAPRTELGQIARFGAGDADGDGRVDLLIDRAQPWRLELHYGKGDGTFESSATTFTRNRWSPQPTIADLDDDGDAELLYLDTAEDTLQVRINLGSRTFAAPAPYPLRHPQRGRLATSFAVRDFDDDDHPDVVATVANGHMTATLGGNGNGSLRPAVHSDLVAPFTQFSPRTLVAADFTGDGRDDLAIGGNAGVTILRNASGEVRFHVEPKYPVVSAGEPLSISAIVSPAEGIGAIDEPPSRTGSVTLKSGPQVLATATPQNGFVNFELASLPVGTHMITAHYAGDASYRSAVSSAVTQKVIAEKTTTTLSSSASGPVPYGQPIYLVATVDSPIAGDLQGRFWRFVDGVRAEFSYMGPPHDWTVFNLAPGTHTLSVEYEGNATQPPSRSNVITQVVTKADSHVEIVGGALQVAVGVPLEIRINITSPSGGTPNGWLHVYEGATELVKVFANGACCSGGMSLDVTLPAFAVEGSHAIRAVFDGDENYEPATSDVRIVKVGDASAGRRRRVRH